MVDDQVGGNEGVRELRIRAHRLQCIAHGGEIHDTGHTREVLQQDPRGPELDLTRGTSNVPAGHVLDIGRPHGAVVFEAKKVLEQNLDAIGQAVYVRNPGALKRLQAEYLVLPVANFQRGEGSETVFARHCF
jgi:hypothetical protein